MGRTPVARDALADVLIFDKKGTVMIRWAILFAILALVAGVLGFGNMAGDFAYIAKILLFVFLVLFVISLVMGGRAVGPPV